MPSILTEEYINNLSRYGIVVEHETKASIDLNLSDYNSVRMSRTLFEILLRSVNNSANIEFNIPSFTFGVEFEFVGTAIPSKVVEFDKSMRDRFGMRYYNASHYYHNDGYGWILGTDSSIQYISSAKNSITGYELSSPKLNYNSKDLEDLAYVINLVKTVLGGEVNSSCGTHIHIGYSINNLYRSQIETLLAVYSNMESVVFDPIVPLSRRRNKYCKKTTTFISNKYQKLSARYCRFTFSRECKSLHLECRQLEGTLEYDVILAWVKLQAYIIYDIISNVDDFEYVSAIMHSNIFDILVRYPFDTKTIALFISRVVLFKSKTIQTK